MINENQTPCIGEVNNNRSRKNKGVAKGDRLEVRRLKEGQWGWFAICFVDGNDKPVFLNPKSLDFVSDISDERKAELDAERKAWRDKGSQPVKLCDIAWESEKAVAVDAHLVCVHTDQAVRQRIFLPKSQVTDGQIPQWLFNAKVEELLEKMGLAGVENRTRFVLENFVEDASVHVTSTPKTFFLVRANEVAA